MQRRYLLTSSLATVVLLVLACLMTTPALAQKSSKPFSQIAYHTRIAMKAVDCSKLSVYPIQEQKFLQKACQSYSSANKAGPDSYHEGNCGFVSVGVFSNGNGNGQYDITIGSTQGTILQVWWNGNWVNYTTGKGAGVSGDVFPSRTVLWSSGYIFIPTGKGYVNLVIPTIGMTTPTALCYGNGDDNVYIS